MPYLNNYKICLLLYFVIATLAIGCSLANDESRKNEHTVNNVSSNNILNSKANADTNVYLYGPSASTITGVIGIKLVTLISHEQEDTTPRDSINVIVLKKGITVKMPAGKDTTGDDGGYPNEYNADTIQLNFSDKYKWAKLNLGKIMGHMVQLKGTFYHAMNGHDFTDVLLSVNEIMTLNDSTVIFRR